MRFFFRSHKFKVMLTITSIVVALALLTSIIGSAFSPQNGVLGAVTSSVTGFFNGISREISSFFDKFESNDELMKENLSLESSLARHPESCIT